MPEFNRRKISLVIADMAGTVTDFGSSAPAAAFVALFRQHGIEATDQQARIPMGMQKRDHVQAMLNMDAIARQWQAKHGKPWTKDDLDTLYAAFIPLQLRILPDYNALIPGAQEAVASIRARGIAVAATTGYNAQMMKVAVEGMADQGLTFDAAVCADDVRSGRPAPWMIYRAMEATGAAPPVTVVKIGDTIADVEAGRNAGVWSIGVTDTGNMAGCDNATWDSLADEDKEERREDATAEMKAAGAHYILRSIADLPSLLDTLDTRIRAGEKP